MGGLLGHKVGQMTVFIAGGVLKTKHYAVQTENFEI